MNRYLVTHSLLSSWLYTMKAIYESPFDDAAPERDTYAEFLATLNREHSEPTEAMQKGIDFENLVTAIVNGHGDPSHKWYEAAQKIAGIIKGGLLQYKAKREIQVRGMELVLYGRLDVLKAGRITDIKFSSNYEVGKYIDSTQHPMYFEIVPEAYEFTYQVSNGSAVWPETYRREDTPSIIPIIEQFLDWLQMQGLIDTYKEKWLAL